MKWRPSRRWLIGILVVLVGLSIRIFWPKPPSFVVSPETTRLVGPLDEEGYIDYPSAVNSYLAEGITRESNANVLILKALGSRPEGSTLPLVYYEWLGIEPPPEEGNYFLEWMEFLKQHVTPPEEGEDEWKKEKTEQFFQCCRSAWKAKDHPEIAKWLARNEVPLVLVLEASKKPHYFNPLFSRTTDPRTARMLNCLLPSAQKCRSLASALKCRAMMKAGEERYEEAWQDLMACRRLGSIMSKTGTLIELLIGYSISLTAIEGQNHLLALYSLPAEQAKAWLKEVQTIPSNPSLSNTLDRVERLVFLDSLQSIALGGDLEGNPNRPVNKRGFWDNAFRAEVNFNPAFQKLNHYYDLLGAIADSEDRETRLTELNRVASEVSNLPNESLNILQKALMSPEERGTRIADRLIPLLFPAMEKIFNAADRVVQSQQNLQIALALAAYHAEKGSYPTRLDDLAPKYLAKVPGDLFSGQPLLYKPTKEGYLLYSVGINEQDDGGLSFDDEPRGDDLRIRIP